MLVIVDRFEGDWALLEWDGEMFRFPRTLLPPEVREGDAVYFDVRVDKEATDARRETIRRLEDELFRK